MVVVSKNVFEFRLDLDTFNSSPQHKHYIIITLKLQSQCESQSTKFAPFFQTNSLKALLGVITL